MGKRGPKKQMEATFLLKLPADLDDAAREAAEAEGVPLSEWWRRAGRDRLSRAKR